MNILYLLIPISLGFALFFVACFIWSIKKGQYDNLETDAHRPLLDD